MEIIIEGQKFIFNANAEVVVASRGYDLDIVDPEFDKESEVLQRGGTAKSLELPYNIEQRIQRCHGLEPCCKVYKDKNGKSRLTAYFD